MRLARMQHVTFAKEKSKSESRPLAITNDCLQISTAMRVLVIPLITSSRLFNAMTIAILEFEQEEAGSANNNARLKLSNTNDAIPPMINCATVHSLCDCLKATLKLEQTYATHPQSLYRAVLAVLMEIVGDKKVLRPPFTRT